MSGAGEASDALPSGVAVRVRRAALLPALAMATLLGGCSSLSAPSWLWPFGGDTAEVSEPPAASPEELRAAARAPVAAVAAPPPVTPSSSLPSGEEAILGFHERADAFYQRLAQRRFNTLATYNDPMLRGYFETQEGYSDYYARLAQELADAHFEKNRPLHAELQEFTMEGPGRARVRYRLEGKSGLPLRFWSTSIEREDVWQQANGRWWIVPGKL